MGHDSAGHLDDLAYAAHHCLADDGTLDMAELNLLVGLALRDRVVDDDERRLLAQLFDGLTADQVPALVWERILTVRSRYGI